MTTRNYEYKARKYNMAIPSFSIEYRAPKYNMAGPYFIIGPCAVAQPAHP